MTDEWTRYRIAQASRWLEHVRRLGQRVDTLREQADAARDAAAGLKGIDYSSVRGGSTGDRMADAVSRVQAAVEGYVSEAAAYEDERAEASARLSAMGDEAAHAALVRHYLLGRSWEECCVEMSYTYDGMMKLRKRGLDEAYDLMPQGWREKIEPAI